MYKFIDKESKVIFTNSLEDHDIINSLFYGLFKNIKKILCIANLKISLFL